MTDFLTTLPWGWYAGFLIVLAVLLLLASYYEDHRLPRARESLDREGER